MPGGVLVLGGFDDTNNATHTVEYFEFATQTWSCRQPMIEPRAQFAATPINPTTVLITGGDPTLTPGGRATSELYVLTAAIPCSGSATDSGIVLAPMTAPRSRHTLTQLPNGHVVVVGSGDAGSPAAELYDVVNGVWRPIP